MDIFTRFKKAPRSITTIQSIILFLSKEEISSYDEDHFKKIYKDLQEVKKEGIKQEHLIKYNINLNLFFNLIFTTANKQKVEDKYINTFNLYMLLIEIFPFEKELLQTKYNPNNKITNNYCPICGQKISQKAKFCPQHYSTINISPRKSKINITREELKRRIRTESFSQISKDFNVSDNGIRKKCQKLNLPYRKKDIDAYSDEEWAKL